MMKRTTVMLTPREFAALQRAARLTGRTQSDLIREGVRRVTMQVPLPGAGGRVAIDTQREWYTREEEQAYALQCAGHGLATIARELRITEEEARLVLARREARRKRWQAMRRTDNPSF
jgi:hypothetical protein